MIAIGATVVQPQPIVLDHYTGTLDHYTGTVQAIYNDSGSYITFTSGQNWVGNLANVKNLAVGSICTLNGNKTFANTFTNGTCKTS